jgi:hypothetical protein
MRRDLEERVKLCNCAKCGQALLGFDMLTNRRLGEFANLPMLRGRIDDRPYCMACYTTENEATASARPATSVR